MNRRSRVFAAIPLLLLMGSTAEAQFGASAPRRLELDIDATCATSDERTALLEALQARLPGLVVEQRGATGPETPVLTWAPSGEGRCAAVLTTPAHTESLPLGPGAGEAEMRAAAIRLAWWLETSAGPSAGAEPPPEAEPGLEPLVAEPPTAPRGPAPAPRAPASFLVTAQFGASWYPTPGKAPGVVRVLLALALTDTVQIGLEARLLTELPIPSDGDVDALDRSLGLLGRYQERVGDRWLVDVSLGLRYAFPQVETDLGDSAEIEQPIANLMVFTGIGIGFELVRALRLKADLLGAVAVAARDIAVPPFPPADMGVLDLDLLFGFELAF